MGQCSSMHESCVGLQNDLQALKERWGENQAKNRRLSSELHHLRKNVGLEASVPPPLRPFSAI
jgi:regulator of replication initiation timing